MKTIRLSSKDSRHVLAASREEIPLGMRLCHPLEEVASGWIEARNPAPGMAVLLPFFGSHIRYRRFV